MEHNVDSTLDQLPKTIRFLILSYCDPQTAVRLIQTNRIWYECSTTTRVWKQIYFNTFSEFNPKPKEKAKNWKEEIKKKISLYGLDYEKYRALVGKVKLTSADSTLKHLRRRKEHRLILNGNTLYMGDFEPNSIRYRELIEQIFEPLFTTNQEVSVTWDFCDEGEPAFEFTKEGLICRLSLVEGTCSGFEADPEWRDVEFLIEDLRAEYIKFLEELQRELLTNYGKDGKRFWKSLNIDWTKYK